VICHDWWRKKMAKKRVHRTIDKHCLSNIWAGWDLVANYPLFSPMARWISLLAYPENPRNLLEGWANINQSGHIQTNSNCLLEPQEWEYIFAHCLLHLGFNHFQPPTNNTILNLNEAAWNKACDVVITRFLAVLKIGKPPERFFNLPVLPSQTEEILYQQFLVDGIPHELLGLGTTGVHQNDMVFSTERPERYSPPWNSRHDWTELFGTGLSLAVCKAVSVAGGAMTSLHDPDKRTPGQQARSWFINSYPLLGSIAAVFNIIEDPALCARMRISVAAIDEELQEIYLNPAAGMNDGEIRFVMAHEMLHAGLRHTARRQGRDAYYWNVACDYVINGWLVEMGLGALPQFGGLYDGTLKGLSAESIYDRIVTDLRRYRKLATLRGVGLGDILEPHTRTNELNGESLDDFYRRCLAQGLVYHQEMGRGLLPGRLVEEIEALGQPPIPWDVALARWFDDHFPSLEHIRTYARPSRRQSATPNIPRPSYVSPPGDAARTFAVLLDTSGSMDRHLLARALGVISSYSLARDVPFVRVVFCDAATYDQGYLSPEEIVGQVKVRGRGGTVLQPGLDLLEAATDFPKDGPILIITDGYCDRLHTRREHAYMVSQGHQLPFVARGPVFYFE
jgi:predicted metal-dependent peptidase